MHLLDQLRNYAQPSIACGWDCGNVVKHVHVLVQKPIGGFYSSVSVELPHITYLDTYKRVSSFLVRNWDYNIILDAFYLWF